MRCHFKDLNVVIILFCGKKTYQIHINVPKRVFFICLNICLEEIFKDETFLSHSAVCYCLLTITVNPCVHTLLHALTAVCLMCITWLTRLLMVR